MGLGSTDKPDLTANASCDRDFAPIARDLKKFRLRTLCIASSREKAWDKHINLSAKTKCRLFKNDPQARGVPASDALASQNNRRHST